MSFKTSIKPYYRVPKRLVKTPRLNVGQIVRRIPTKTKQKSRIVAIQKVWKGNVPKALEGYVCYRALTQNTQNGNKYKLAVYSPDVNITTNTKIIVDSPNPLFVFRYEVAMARRGNAFVYRSNGDMPMRTNPKLVPGVDHHMLRFIRYLVKNTNRNGLK